MAVAGAHQLEKGLKVCLSLLVSAQDDPMAGLQIQDPKQHPLGIVSGNGHERLLTFVGPPMAQRRKEAQDSFILKEDHGIRYKLS